MNELDRLRAAYPTLADQTPPAATVARLQSLYDDPFAQRPTPAPAQSRRRRRRPSRRIGLLAIAGVIVSGTAVAATSGGWRPLLGSADRPRPLGATSSVPADHRAALAVLRRPQTEADRGPLVQQALRKLSRETINGIHTDAIRVLFRAPREVVVLVPAQRAGPRIKGSPSSKATQRDVLYVMSGSYQNARTWKITSGGKRKTVRFPAGYHWGATSGTLETLRTTGIQTGTSPNPGGGLVLNGRPQRSANRRVTLVPDGVARVRVRLRGGRFITVPVRNNVYRYTIDGVSVNPGTVWFDAAGRRINRRKRP